MASTSQPDGRRGLREPPRPGSQGASHTDGCRGGRARGDGEPRRARRLQLHADDRLFGNLSANITPRVGVLFDDYTSGAVLTGTLPDGSTYSVPTFVANPAQFAASGGGFTTTNVPGYHTDYRGIEFNLVKRLSNRWMGRLGMSFQSSTENFDDPKGKYNTNGNPTPTAAEPLQDGGQFAPTPSVAGGIFLNARWQFNANAMYIAPYGIEVAANIFGRQGYPFPIYRTRPSVWHRPPRT